MPRSVKDFTSRRGHQSGNRIPRRIGVSPRVVDTGLRPRAAWRNNPSFPVLWTRGGIRLLNLAIVVFSWIVGGTVAELVVWTV